MKRVIFFYYNLFQIQRGIKSFNLEDQLVCLVSSHKLFGRQWLWMIPHSATILAEFWTTFWSIWCWHFGLPISRVFWHKKKMENDSQIYIFHLFHSWKKDKTTFFVIYIVFCLFVKRNIYKFSKIMFVFNFYTFFCGLSKSIQTALLNRIYVHT